MWDWCLRIGLFILVGHWHNLTSHLVFVNCFSIRAFSSSSKFKTLLLSQYFYYDGVCKLPIHSVLWSLISPITIIKNLETLFQCVNKWLQPVPTIVCSVSCCAVLMKGGTDFLLIGEVFRKWCQNMCNISTVSEETTVPVFVSAFITHHTPTLTLCNVITWLTMGGFLFWQFTCTL
jgi:hypothetical protein